MAGRERPHLWCGQRSERRAVVRGLRRPWVRRFDLIKIEKRFDLLSRLPLSRHAGSCPRALAISLIFHLAGHAGGCRKKLIQGAKDSKELARWLLMSAEGVGSDSAPEHSSWRFPRLRRTHRRRVLAASARMGSHLSGCRDGYNRTLT
jgi:hypothetical protein